MDVNKKSQGVVAKKTLCNMCPSGCGLELHIQEGKIVRVLPMEEHFYKNRKLINIKCSFAHLLHFS